jgi:hypothetical protein
MGARRERVFLLSPAHCGGKRAQLVLSARATFDLAVRLRSTEGAPLGEVFSFLSGLYFRGKLTYARAFARPRDGCSGVFVITPTDGLLPPETPVAVRKVSAFAEVDVDLSNARYRDPLARTARRLAREIDGACEVVLLGSIATDKYAEVLCEVFGERLLFPADFVGRGDMSRGGLLLRAAKAARELDYVPLARARRHGPRPPRLAPLPRTR